MAVTKVLITCVFIGFLLKQVHSQPTKRKWGDIKHATINIYKLPRPLQLHDTFDIEIKVQNHPKSFNISLMAGNITVGIFMIKTKEDNEQCGEYRQFENQYINNEGQAVTEECLDNFIHGSKVNMNFTVRKNVNTGEINLLQIGGKSGPGTTTELLDDELKLSDIDYLKIVGYELKVTALNFSFSLSEEL